MTCTRIPNGFICSFTESITNMEPYGAKVWMEWHSHLGPIFYRSENTIKPIIKPSKKTWDAFKKWQEETRNGPGIAATQD